MTVPASAVAPVLPPLPDLSDPDTAPFWQAAHAQKLVVQQCEGCGHLRFPPHPFCAICRSPAASWLEVSGSGSIWSFVVAHKPTLPAFEFFTPYPVVVVELKEGAHLRMVGNVISEPGAAINSVNPSRLSIGMPVSVSFESLTDEVSVPRWIIAAPVIRQCVSDA